MKKIKTVLLSEVKDKLRRGEPGAIHNISGWCVYVAGKGRPRFVVDDETSCPVPYQTLRPISEIRAAIPTALNVNLG